jgi:hypothetical protein
MARAERVQPVVLAPCRRLLLILILMLLLLLM